MTIRTGTAKILIAANLLAVSPVFGNTLGSFFNRNHKTEQMHQNESWKEVEASLQKALADLKTKDIKEVMNYLGDLRLDWGVQGRKGDAIAVFDWTVRYIADSRAGHVKESLEEIIKAGILAASNEKLSDIKGKFAEVEPGTEKKTDSDKMKEKEKADKEKEDSEKKKKEDDAKKLEEQQKFEEARKKAEEEVKEKARQFELEKQRILEEARKKAENEIEAQKKEKPLSTKQKVMQDLAALDKEYKEKNGTFSTLDELKDFASRLKNAVDAADRLGADIDYDAVEAFVEKLGTEEKRLKAPKTEKKEQIEKKEEIKVTDEKKEELKVEKKEEIAPKVEEKKEETVPKIEEKKEAPKEEELKVEKKSEINEQPKPEEKIKEVPVEEKKEEIKETPKEEIKIEKKEQPPVKEDGEESLKVRKK